MDARQKGGPVGGWHLYEREGSSVLHCHYTVAGKLIRHSTGERDRSRADEAAARAYLEAHIRARVPVPASSEREPLRRIGAAFLADLERRLERRELIRSPRYFKDAKFALARVTQRWTDIAEIGPGWKNALLDWHAEGTGYRYLQIVTVFARALLRWAEEAGHMHGVTMPKLRGPQGEDVSSEASERRPLSEDERDRVLAEIKKLSPRAHRIYTVLFYTGARKSDLERMQLRQIDWKSGFVKLPPRQTKSKARDQVLWMHPKALKAIRAEIATSKIVDPEALVFGPFNSVRVWALALDKAKISDRDGLTPHHVTRHTAATIAGDKGATLAELMAFGRWATPQMAARYMKVNAAQAKKAGERL